jgi:NDP-sugar pyrophosphorylase family protein
MKALILAAGLGTRLGRLTADRPKCMMLVDGRPLVERLVCWVRDHGISEIAINLHYHPERIVEHLGTGARFGVRITYSHEARLLGTAGAAKRLEGYFDGPFCVVYGDGYTNMDLGRLMRLHADRARVGVPHATMALFRAPDPSACGVVELGVDRQVTRLVEKPPPSEVFSDLASAGIFVLDRELLDLLRPGAVADFGRDLLPAALGAGLPVYGEPLRPREFLVDIGTPAAYEQAVRHARHGADTPIAGR